MKEKKYKIHNKNKKQKHKKLWRTYKTIKDSHIHTALKDHENAMKTMKTDFKAK